MMDEKKMMCPHYEEKIRFDEFCACAVCRNFDTCWTYLREEFFNRLSEGSAN